MGRIGLLGKILDLIAPRTCAICNRRLKGDEETVCTECLFDLPLTDNFLNPADNEMAKLLWGKVTPERCMSLFYFHPHGLTSRIIYQLKYGNHPEIGQYFGRYIVRETEESGFFDGIDLLVPTPLSKKRKRQRGYNQCEQIAMGIQELTHIPICNQAVERVSFRQSQTQLHGRERMENVEHAFRLVDESAIAGKHILLIDDVFTTGATLAAIAQECLKAKEVKISILTIGFTKQ